MVTYAKFIDEFAELPKRHPLMFVGAFVVLMTSIYFLQRGTPCGHGSTKQG